MTVSDQEMPGGRSPSQGNESWMTTARGTYGAESRSSAVRDSGQPAVPHLVGGLLQAVPVLGAVVVEQAQVDRLRAGRPQREVRADAVPVRPEGRGSPGQHLDASVLDHPPHGARPRGF